MLGIYKHYREVTMDYRLCRLINPRFYRLVPTKKLCPASSDTLDKLEQGAVLLPVTFVSLLMAGCGSTTGHIDSSPPQKQRGKRPNTADNTDHYFVAFLLCKEQ